MLFAASPATSLCTIGLKKLDGRSWLKSSVSYCKKVQRRRAFFSLSFVRASSVHLNIDQAVDMENADVKPMAPGLSRRIVGTDTPIMVQMTQLLGQRTNILSLGQGIVYWQPPAAALEVARQSVSDPKVHGYGQDDGTVELRAALVEKVKDENQLMNSSIMVTAGANQAFFNVVVTLCDPEDSVVLFKPYYFNHQMAFQMTGVTKLLYGECDPETMHPSADWVDKALAGEFGPVPRVITICNPCNPTGTYVPAPLLERISNACKAAGTWLVMDNTYEYFMYEENKHFCVEGDHIVNVFSFSKAYGMMGWRVGYIAYPTSVPDLGASLLKAQDTIPICANLLAQRVALSALSEGPDWVRERVKTLIPNRKMVFDALVCLGEGNVKGGEAGIYVWARLPNEFQDDKAVVKWLVERHGVAVIPGSASGVPGHLRIAFGNVDNDKCRLATERLKTGLQELTSKGMTDSPS